MSQLDSALRTNAIPYYANVWGYNRTNLSDGQICPDVNNSSPTWPYPNLGDLKNFAPNLGVLNTINPIRVLQPHFGNIIECNLNLKFTLAAAEASRQFRIAIGTYSSRYTPQTSYSDAYINASHQLITGQSAPFTIPAAGTFSMNKLNLLPDLYKRGDPNFLEDAFVVLLVFDSAPSTGTGWAFTRFEVDCTMQMGLK